MKCSRRGLCGADGDVNGMESSWRLEVEGGCARSSKTVDLYLFTHLSPWVGLNLREFELGVVWVHFPNLLPCGSAEHL